MNVLEGQKYSHRMGDLGYFDTDGRLWLCGRKSHRIDYEDRQYLPLCVEGWLNHHPSLQHLIQVALAQSFRGAALCVHPLQPLSQSEWVDTENALMHAIEESPVTQGIRLLYRYESPFPVDTRHNSKIKREVLSQWVNARQRRVD